MHVPERSAVVLRWYTLNSVQILPAQGVGEALRRGWRARSGEGSFVLQTQSRREESEREAEAMEEAEKEAKRAVEREKEVASSIPIVVVSTTHISLAHVTSAHPRHLLPPHTAYIYLLSPHPTPPTTRPTTAYDAPRPTTAYFTWAVSPAPSATPQQPSP